MLNGFNDFFLLNNVLYFDTIRNLLLNFNNVETKTISFKSEWLILVEFGYLA